MRIHLYDHEIYLSNIRLIKIRHKIQTGKIRAQYIYVMCFIYYAALMCYCDVCPETNNSCETDGYCFTSTTLEKGFITHSYRYTTFITFVYHIQIVNIMLNLSPCWKTTSQFQVIVALMMCLYCHDFSKLICCLKLFLLSWFLRFYWNEQYWFLYNLSTTL